MLSLGSLAAIPSDEDRGGPPDPRKLRERFLPSLESLQMVTAPSRV